jgi:hypothetical protein
MGEGSDRLRNQLFESFRIRPRMAARMAPPSKPPQSYCRIEKLQFSILD